MGRRPARVLTTIAALLLWMPAPAMCGLLGSSVIGTPYFPALGSIGGTGHAAGPILVADPAVEFPEGLILYSGHIDITDHQILWIPTISTTYLTSSFNGFELDFIGAPPITSVRVNPSSALDATSIVFTTDKVFVNFSGKTVVSGVPAVFDVNPVPEPETIALLGLGLAGLASTPRRRN